MVKSCTDIEQSKVLCNILDYTTADMSYSPVNYNMPDMLCDVPNTHKPYDDDLPCWSLAALFKVLPVRLKDNNSIIRMDMGPDKFYLWYEIGFNMHSMVQENNAVDACYVMINKLHNEGIKLNTFNA